jgi:long-chain acyl-CoA synthetase
MGLLDRLQSIWSGTDKAFLLKNGQELRFSDLSVPCLSGLDVVRPGDVVAIVGDFDRDSIVAFLRLIDIGAVVVPLTGETLASHAYFFESAHVDFIFEKGILSRRHHHGSNHLLERIRSIGHPGLILFSTGTTGAPKAILHDMHVFLKRFETPRPALRTMSFLLFDHIGGINTLFHTLFNKGVVIAPQFRTVDSILDTCGRFNVEVLPTTPTFLRLLLISGAVPGRIPDSLSVVTYGTECMDQFTLDELCRLMPNVDFRQTYGMSELGIVRAKSEGRNSLYLKIGGDGVETRLVGNILQIRSPFRMLGYLNAPSPFDSDGWYDTKDVVEKNGDYYKIEGRIDDVVNVGGLKFLLSDVERVALSYPGVALAKVISKKNPITGEHVELTVQPVTNETVSKDHLIRYLRNKLQSHMIPRRVSIGPVSVGHRFKKI